MVAVSPIDKTVTPAPGSPEEHSAFQTLQARLPELFREVFSDPRALRTVVVVPSLSLDQEVMANISGVGHYEERLLCLLLLLRLPRARLIYVTSKPIPESIIDYYLHLLPGVPSQHARRRLTLICCHDTGPECLTAKILARPRVIDRIRAAIPDRNSAHMTCFNVSGQERSLAVQLGVPIYGCNPDLLELGSKGGSRTIFRQAGVTMPDGFEGLLRISRRVLSFSAASSCSGLGAYSSRAGCRCSRVVRRSRWRRHEPRWRPFAQRVRGWPSPRF